MIDWMWIDADGNPLIELYRVTPEQTMVMKSESMPEINPSGQVITVPFTGIRLFVGSSALVAGAYTMNIGTYGRKHSDAFALQKELMIAAQRTAFIVRNPGGSLPIASFSKITRSFKGDAQLGGEVQVVFEPSEAYWLTPMQTIFPLVNTGTPLTVSGSRTTPVGFSLFNNGAPFANMVLYTDAGATQFLGTIPTGSTFRIDSRPGFYTVTLDGLDVSTQLSGPQPYLKPGDRAIYINAIAGICTLTWQEGDL